MWWILVNCVSGTSKYQYINKKNQFMLWVFDEGEPPKKIFLDPWMVGDVDYSCHIHSNNKCIFNLIQVYKEMLYVISVDNDNCPILLNFCLSWYFPGT